MKQKSEKKAEPKTKQTRNKKFNPKGRSVQECCEYLRKQGISATYHPSTQVVELTLARGGGGGWADAGLNSWRVIDAMKRKEVNVIINGA